MFAVVVDTVVLAASSHLFWRGGWVFTDRGVFVVAVVVVVVDTVVLAASLHRS